MKTLPRRLRIFIIVAALLCLIGILVLLAVNLTVIATTHADIGEFSQEDGYMHAVVLGAKVHKDGTLSDMLKDRMDAAITLYHDGVVEKLLLSGDNSGAVGEVTAMKVYAMKNGVPEDAILEDYEGYSTYESMDRAKNVFGLDSFVVVTQKYHLYRAIYIAEDMDIDAKGVSADLHTYAGQLYRDLREVLARLKDFGLCLLNG